MARKPKDTTPIESDQIDEQVAQSISETQNQAAALAGSYGDERDELNQILGQIQMGRAFAKLADVVSLSKLAHIKESKKYRALAGKRGIDPYGNEIADVGTWEGFCLAVGTTRSKVDEDLINLKTFGEEALEGLNSVGAGYRELRQYRRLPEDDKTALIEVAKSGDKDAFVEVAEQLISKHAKEKEEVNKKLEETTANYEAQGLVLADAQRKNADLQTKAQLLKKLPPDEAAAQMREEASQVCDEVESLIRLNVGHTLEQVLNSGKVDEDNPLLNNAQTSWLEHRLDLLDEALLAVRAQIGIERSLEEKDPVWLDPNFDDNEEATE